MPFAKVMAPPITKLDLVTTSAHSQVSHFFFLHQIIKAKTTPKSIPPTDHHLNPQLTIQATITSHNHNPKIPSSS